MSSEPPFSRYVSLIDVNDENAQNVQELASIWGEVDAELERIGAEVEESYAVMGEEDFMIVFQAPSTDVAFQASIVLEGHGLDVQTMEITPTEHFSRLVADV